VPEGWSWITGHIFVLLRYASRYPPLVQVALVTREMLLSFPDSEMFLLDLWPTFSPTIHICNPEALSLITQKYNYPKVTSHMGPALNPIVGGPTILSMNGQDWKTWRTRLNPGFSDRSLVDHVPFIVDRVQVFCDKLTENAGRGIISLDDFASKLTFEVIMKVTLSVPVLLPNSSLRL
jgi:cytochrome P450